jgi:hypothetical protein
MDQQNNRAVPGAATDNGQPQQEAQQPQHWAQQGHDGPSPVWEGTPQENTPDREPPGWDGPPVGQQGQPAPGWGAPGQADSTWGTTPALREGANAGTGWGAPQSYSPNGSGSGRTRTWTAKKGMVAGCVAVVVAAAAGAGAYAAANGSGAAAADSQGAGAQAGGGQGGGGQGGGVQGGGAHGQFGPGSQSGMTGPGGAGGGMNGGPSGLGMGMGGLNAAIHSEYVILQDSNYVTMAGQTGTVTSISGSSLTVKSDDGFTRTYGVGTDVQVLEGMRQRGNSAGSTLDLSAVTAGASVRVTALKESDAYRAESIQLATSGTSTAPNPGTSTAPNPGSSTAPNSGVTTN